MRIIDMTPGGFGNFLRGGREKAGEDLVAAQLGKHLDDTHTLLRHLTLPHSTERLGFVLVGPEGIWHLELLHLTSLVNNGGVWMHWDYGQQGVQPVQLSKLAGEARSRLAELQGFLGPAGFGARQAMIVTVPNSPREFTVPNVDMLLFVEEIGEFAKEALPQYAPTPPLEVDSAVNVLTGKTAAPPPAEGARTTPAWLTRRYGRLGSLTGWQLLVLGGLGLLNCCLLSVVANLLFGQ